MDNDVQKIITEQLKILPKDVKEAIVSVDYKTKLQEITKRQVLLIDQAGKLEMETTLVMIGLEPLADYVANLQRELGVPLMKAKEIAMDISENIFKPIRLSLQKMNETPDPNKVPEPQTLEEDKLVSVNKTTDGEESDKVALNLDRNQILDEIENPVPNHPSLRQNPLEQTPVIVNSTQLEIRPVQQIDTLPGQGVRDVSQDIIKNKMTSPTIVSEQIIDAVPETKLPEIKKKPYGGVDPYKEPLN